MNDETVLQEIEDREPIDQNVLAERLGVLTTCETCGQVINDETDENKRAQFYETLRELFDKNKISYTKDYKIQTE